MANIRISKRNIADRATISSSPTMSPSVAALQRQDRWDMAKTTFTPGLGSPTIAQVIRLTWSSAQRAAMFWLRMHNFSTSALIKVEHFSAADWTSSIYNSGFLTGFSTDGLDTVLDDHTERDFRLLKLFVLYHALFTTIRSTEITILDANSAEGWTEASRLGMAEYYEPAENPGFGAAEMTFRDASTQDEAEDGSVRTDKSFKGRMFKIDLEFVPDEELDTLLALLRYQGLDHDFVVDLYPEETGAKALYNRALMKFTSIDALNPHMWGQHRNSMPMKEA